jgi:hypothetical protein
LSPLLAVNICGEHPVKLVVILFSWVKAVFVSTHLNGIVMIKITYNEMPAVLTSLAKALPLYFKNLKVVIYPDNIKNSVFTSQRMQSVFIREVNRTMLSAEWRAV